MDLIKSIISKPGWETKINDSDITKKWKKELSDQEAHDQALDKIIELLHQYKEIKDNTYEEYEEKDYDWIANVGIDCGDLGIDCSCDCYMCEGGLKPDRDELEEQEYEEDEIDEIMAKRCECIGMFKINAQDYLESFIDKDTAIGSDLNSKLIESVNNFTKDKETDFHPGSNKQVVDIVHPSLYCYTKGITKVKPGVQVDSNILYQWLPSEFSVGRDDSGNINRVSINSYINNIDHKKYPDLYKCVGEIFGKFVPAFEKVTRNLKRTDKIETYKDLSECQVIVKLGSTILGKENPIFDGGSWHLEGIPAEKIIATGIYYYDMDNIDENKLEFRATINSTYEAVQYPQNGTDYVEVHYGMHSVEKPDSYSRDYSSIVDLGHIKTKKGLGLVFPNFLQHKVSPFKLQDVNKSGHRDILVFFLVDPSQKILSTADVKQQQSKMPLDHAKFYRELLMFQRKYEIADQNAFYERGWSLCEH